MNRLKELREQAGLSQIEAANLLNISRRTYQKYESLENNTSDKLMYLIYLFDKKTSLDEEHGVLTVDFIRDELNEIFIKYDVRFCYLFGSYAKGYAKDNSDVDLLIDTDITGLDYFGLIEEIRERLHKKIDLVNLKSILNNFELLRDIYKDGIKIYEQCKR